MISPCGVYMLTASRSVSKSSSSWCFIVLLTAMATPEARLGLLMSWALLLWYTV